MAKPFYHAQNSAKKYGGVPEDYVDIHDFMDLSKGTISDNRHRALTHNSWFMINVIPRVFGAVRVNSDGRKYVPSQIAEDHIAEDFGMKFIPTAQDWLQEIPMDGWMMNGRHGFPPSYKSMHRKEDE
jgi:hypothetical protein